MGLVHSVLRLATKPIDFTLDWLQAYALGHSSTSPYLLGNFAPVPHELLRTNLKVEGQIPADLAGEFVRNGPNPKYIPRGGYHWFDGDGMLHGVRLHDQTVTYLNRYIHTERFELEAQQRSPQFLRIGEMRGKSGLLKILFATLKAKLGLGMQGRFGHGTANTALTFHNGTLYALVEADHPFALRILQDGQFEQLGRESYGDKLQHPMTAHPKVDPQTNELLFFGYQLRDPPPLTYSVVSAQGALLHSTPIALRHPVMMHDFAITENYSLFLDMPLEFHPERIVSGDVFMFNAKQPARVGIIPRHPRSADEITWHEFETGFVFHTINAYEEGDEVVLFACRSASVELSALTCAESDLPYAYCYRINRVTGEKSERRICDIPGEFPVIHPALLGRKNRYAYIASLKAENNQFLFDGVFKLDLHSHEVLGHIVYGERAYAGECVFVPRQNALEEDDGYLMSFVYDGADDSSSFVIFDAKSMSALPIASVKLPQRVPFGFHGIFVSEEQIRSQTQSLAAQSRSD